MGVPLLVTVHAPVAEDDEYDVTTFTYAGAGASTLTG